MPRVPTASNLVALQPVTDAKFRTFDAGSEAIGEGLQRLGRSMDRATRYEAERRDLIDEANVKRADVLAAREVSETTARYLASEGFDALDASGKAEKDLNKIRDAHVAGLKGERQRRMFRDVFDARVTAEIGKIRAHETRQIGEAGKQAAGARLKTYFDRSVEFRDDPDERAKSLDTALGELPKMYPGAGPDFISQKRAEIISSHHVAVIDALTDQDPAAAKRWADEHAGSILEGDETLIRRKLRPAVEEAELDSAMTRLEEIVSSSPEPDRLPASNGAPEGARGRVARANSDPLRGRGHGISNTAAQHRARGSDNALDIPAAAGTPVYPPMSGTVIGSWYDKEGGNSILVRHPNGRVTGYAHLRSRAVDKGEEVDANTVLGGVGNTGTASRGNHLHYTVRTREGGPRVDPATVSWEESNLPAYNGDRLDKKALYDAARTVATERNFSRRQYDALLARVDAVVGREDAIRARVEKDRVEAAWDVAERLGDAFTRRDQVPDWGLLPAEDRMRLGARIEQNIAPKPIAANGDTVLTFEIMSVKEPEKFNNTDLRPYRHMMTSAEFSTLAKTQAEMRQKGPEAPVAIDHGNIWTMINRYGGDVGLSPNSAVPDQRKRTMRVFDFIRKDLERITEGKRKPTDDEIKASFDRATMNVVLPGAGVFGGDRTVRRFDNKENAPVRISIPVDVRDRIVRAYRMAEGRDPNETEIGTMYLRKRGQRGYWQ